MIDCLASVVDTAQPQIILVEGERGLGKTALCNAFVSRATSQMVLRVSRAEGHESAAADGVPPLVVDALSLLLATYGDAGVAGPEK